MPRVILSLDPSTAATGWALYENGDITTCGFEAFQKIEGEREGERLIRAHDWLLQMIRLFKVDTVIIEQYFFRSKFSMGSDLNPELRGAFKMACAKCDVDHAMSIPSQWKKVVAGRMSPTRAEKRKWGKTKAKKIFIVKAIEKKYGLEFPKKIPNPVTGKQINFKHDISDALGILIAYLKDKQLPFHFSSGIFEFELPE